jgi:folate-dependent phosphoribosylglycinamide formyltransferase PurN
MTTEKIDPGRQIRVVVFSGGPVLEHGVKQFMCLLEDHPEIEFLACICQSNDQSFRAIVADLWRRRGMLALPLLLIQTVEKVWRRLSSLQIENGLNAKVTALSERIYYVSDIHAEQVLDQVKGLELDLGLIYGSPILKPRLFEIPRFGTLGIHHGQVPQYRGKKTTFWAIYNGERTAGVTIQKVNAGLDTGEIAKTGAVPIGKRPLRAVWKDLEMLGLDLYIQTILEVKEGTANYQPQTRPKGKLYRDPSAKDIFNYWWKRTRSLLGLSSKASPVKRLDV